MTMQKDEKAPLLFQAQNRVHFLNRFLLPLQRVQVTTLASLHQEREVARLNSVLVLLQLPLHPQLVSVASVQAALLVQLELSAQLPAQTRKLELLVQLPLLGLPLLPDLGSLLLRLQTLLDLPVLAHLQMLSVDPHNNQRL